METKNVKNNKKMSKIDKIGRKILQNCIFWRSDFWLFFWQPKNRIIKNVKIWSNDTKFLSRHIKEGFKTQFLGHLNHPGKFFFLTIERWTCQNFHFLQKTIEKLMFLYFLKFENYKIFIFHWFFQQKWIGTKTRKTNFT